MLIILFCCSILPAPVFAEGAAEPQATLQSASELDYPPFAIVKPDGTAAGFSVDLLKAATEAVGLSVSFKVGPWNVIKQELIDKNIDVLPLVSYSKERDKVYDFTAPYLRMNGTVFVRKGNTEIQHLSDLQDKEVLVMEGDTAHEYVVTKKLSKNVIPTVSYDEAPIAKMAGKVLGQLGYSVTTRTSSIEALELFRSKPNDYDLVISDVTMPKMAGDQLTRKLIEIRPDIPVILCTGYSKKFSERSASEIGIKAFARKPIIHEEFAKTVRRVLDDVVR